MHRIRPYMRLSMTSHDRPGMTSHDRVRATRLGDTRIRPDATGVQLDTVDTSQTLYGAGVVAERLRISQPC
jgi:hypothetical protein